MESTYAPAAGAGSRGPRGLGLALVLTAGAGCGETEAPRDAAEPRRPNVLLISIDSLRADHLGAWGYPFDTSPTIDRLAREGARFTQAVSTTSWTLPSHVALVTGLSDVAHGVTLPRHRIDDSIQTLAESFAAAGYQTTGLYSGPFLHPDYGFDQGFERYVDCTSYGLGGLEVTEVGDKHGDSHEDVTNPTIRSRFVEALEGCDERPQFFFVHMWDVHYDLVPPESYVDRFDPEYGGEWPGHDFQKSPHFELGMDREVRERVMALYDGEIRFTDDTIGELLAALDGRGLTDDAIVAVTADHGEEFLDHGNRGHMKSLYREVVHVPLVFWSSEGIEPIEIHEPVGLIDVAPTILELAGIEPVAVHEGRSLVDAIEGEPLEPRPILSFLRVGAREPLVAVRVGDEKLVIDHENERRELFDLTEDPHERHGLDDPDRVEELEEIARAMRAAAEARAGHLDGVEIELDPDVEARLRELGYVE